MGFRVIWGIVWGSIIGLTKGDTRSLDFCSYEQNLKHEAYIS